MPSHVFICYARKDADFVKTLAGHLQERALPIWLDEWSIAPGAEWEASIGQAIRACASFLVVLSPALTTSDVACKEWTLALSLRKPIVPVGYLPCDVPPELARYQIADFSGWQPGDPNRLERLVSVLKGEPLPLLPPSPRRNFLSDLQAVLPSARAFDADLTHAMAVDLTRRLSDQQFVALHDLRAAHDRYDRGARGIVESLILERIGGQQWEASAIFETLRRFGFFALSQDLRQRNHPDSGYEYTPLFWGYTNLMRYLNAGDLGSGTDPEGNAYWLSPPDTD